MQIFINRFWRISADPAGPAVWR